jgi:hypothetical protein
MSLSPEAERALPALLDTLVPPSLDGRLAGAGALGLASDIRSMLDDNPGLEPVVESGLSAANARARARFDDDFAALDLDQRCKVIEEIADEQPGLVPALSFHTFVAYYQHASVLQGLGLEPRPPHPEGYAVDESDLSLLDPVRARKPLYRD